LSYTKLPRHGLKKSSHHLIRRRTQPSLEESFCTFTFKFILVVILVGQVVVNLLSQIANNSKMILQKVELDELQTLFINI